MEIAETDNSKLFKVENNDKIFFFFEIRENSGKILNR